MRIVLDPNGGSEGVTEAKGPHLGASVGVDFGTNTTRISVAYPSKLMPQLLRNELGNEGTTTAVYYGNDSDLVGADGSQWIGVDPRSYGETASTRQFIKASDTVMDIVPWLLGSNYGDSIDRISATEGEHTLDTRVVAGKEYHPVQVAAYFLRQILQLLPKELYALGTSTNGAHPSICISVPTCACPPAVRATRQAAVLAGVSEYIGPKRGLLIARSEEAAAAYFHHSQLSVLKSLESDTNPNANLRVTIVDIGDSSASAATFEFSSSRIRKLAVQSCDRIGSGFIDRILSALVYEEIERKYASTTPDIVNEIKGDLKSFRKILRECKKAKEVLSTTDETSFVIEGLHGGTLDIQISLSKKRMEERMQPFLEQLRTMLVALQASTPPLEEAGNDGGSGAHRVEVVGGGWRTPCVQDTLKEVLQVNRLGVALDANLCITEGSAILAQMVLNGSYFKDDKANETIHPAHQAELVDFDIAEHFREVDAPGTAPREPFPDAAALSEIETQQIMAWAEVERELTKKDEIIHERLQAINSIDAYVLQTLQGIERMLEHNERSSTSSGDKNEDVKSKAKKVQEYLTNVDEHYIREDDCKADPTDRIKAKLNETQLFVSSELPELGNFYELEREKEREQEEKLRKLHEEQQQEEENNNPEDVDYKSDPQRLRMAQKRREQGVTLFKEECYAEAQKRFVQALAALSQLYDTTDEQTLKTKNEISLSCYLNIASCCVKLQLFQKAIDNAASALAISPDNKKAQFRKGQALAGLKEYKKAMEAFTLAGKDDDALVKSEYEKVAALYDQEKKKEKKMFAKMFS